MHAELQPTFEERRIGGAIAVARKHARLTQAELAGRVRVSRRLISDWENGHAQPSIGQWLDLADITASPALLDLSSFAVTGTFTGRELDEAEQQELPLGPYPVPSRRAA